jgi:hypothetical protein
MRRVEHGTDQRAFGRAPAGQPACPILHIFLGGRRRSGSTQDVLVNDPDKFGWRHGNRIAGLGRILDRRTIERVGDLVNVFACLVALDPVRQAVRLGNAIEEGDIQFDQGLQVGRVHSLCLRGNIQIDRHIGKLKAIDVFGQSGGSVGAGIVEDGIAAGVLDDRIVCAWSREGGAIPQHRCRGEPRIGRHSRSRVVAAACCEQDRNTRYGNDSSDGGVHPCLLDRFSRPN